MHNLFFSVFSNFIISGCRLISLPRLLTLIDLVVLPLFLISSIIASNSLLIVLRYTLFQQNMFSRQNSYLPTFLDDKAKTFVLIVLSFLSLDFVINCFDFFTNSIL